MSEVSGSKIAGGAAWMMSARLADRAIGLGSTVILARLLVPEDFGLVAMAMAIISLIEVTGAFGFEIPLIRAANPDRRLYDTVWTLNLLFGLFCAVAIVASSWPATLFYGDPRLFPVMVTLSLGWLAGSFSNIGIVDFRRNLDFAKEFRYLMSVRLISFCVTIPCALYFRSYWALIAGMVTGRCMAAVLSYVMHPYRPRLCLAAGKDLFNFSIWIFIEKVATLGYARTADFVLGKTHGAAALGVYRIGEEIGFLPGTELIAPINRALLPGVTKMVNSGRQFADLTKSATGVVVMLLAPACLGICAVAEPSVRVLLGPNWMMAVPVVQVTCISSLIMAMWGNQTTILLAAGLPKISGLVSVLRFILLLVLVFFWVPKYGVMGVAWSALVSAVIPIAIGMTLSMPRLGITLGSYISVIWRPLLAASVMFVSVQAVLAQWDGESAVSTALAQLLAGIASGVVVFTATSWLLYLLSGRPPGAESLILERLGRLKSTGDAA